MTLQGFIIGMSFILLAFLVVWMLNNVGIEKHKRENHSNDNGCS
ncbi:hypothetical protein CKA32_007134 [Geitlerinema sp. FC II]|nr:hypothetical protein CKA32_007134 [Geitlerinema sp. FC II]